MGMRRGKMIAAVLTVCAVGAGMTVNAYAEIGRASCRERV